MGGLSVAAALDGHVTLDLSCFDRLYLNGYVARIQTAAATVVFLTRHRGNPIPSPALFQPMGEAFRRDVARFAREHELPVIRFTRGERKRDRMRPYLERAARLEHDGVVALGLAQENQSVWMGTDVHRGPTGVPHYAFRRVMRRISVFYFYFHDREWGPSFIKVASYFPYPIKLWCNGHERAKRELTRRGIAYTALDNGFASCADPAALQRICDALGPADLESLFRRSLGRIPLPLSPTDRAAGYDWELSMSQIEYSRTLVLDRPARGRAFFERVIAENLSLGRPSFVSLIFDRKIRSATPGQFRTTVVTPGVDPRLSIHYRSSRVKEYLKEGRAIRIETTINDPYKDLRIHKRIRHLLELRDRAREMNDRILSLQRAASTPDLAASLFERVALPSVCDGQRTVALRYGDPRVMALLAALALAVHHVAPFSNAELRANVERLLGTPYRPAQMTYDLRRLRAKGLIRRLEHRNQYVPTTDGTKVAVLFTKTYERIVRPLLAVDDAPPDVLVELRQAFRTIDRAVTDHAKGAGLAA
jgi:hypothetical protein